MAKHPLVEFEKVTTWEDHAADAITAFCGRMLFVYLHMGWFALWVAVNIGLLVLIPAWDPYPFGLLTLIVSLEAIFLSTFVMISQNRTAWQADFRAQLDYETNVKAEREVEEMICMLKEIHVALGLSDPVPDDPDAVESASVGLQAQRIIDTLHQQRRRGAPMAETPPTA